MLPVQLRLFPRPSRVRVRSLRRPFRPSQPRGPYRLPHDVRDRLVAALAPFKNRDAALALAVFLARFWSTPSRIVDAFAVDRRELADRADLGLTEARLRGAIRALEEVGFLDRAVAGGGKHKLTEDGELHRKPVLFRFGSDFAIAFSNANARARKARERRSRDRRPGVPGNTSRPSVAVPVTAVLKSPKWKGSEADRVYLGELTKAPALPQRPEPNPEVEAALERLRMALRERV